MPFSVNQTKHQLFQDSFPLRKRVSLANPRPWKPSHVFRMLQHHKPQKFYRLLRVIRILSAEEVHTRAPLCLPVYFLAVREYRPRSRRAREIASLDAHVHYIVQAADVDFARRASILCIRGGSKDESHFGLKLVANTV